MDQHSLLTSEWSICTIKNPYTYLISMEYIRFSLVWFYGISSIIGYSMPNPLYIYIYIILIITIIYHSLIGLVGRVFANGLEDLGSIPGCIIPKTLKMVLDTALLNTQQYKVCIKGKVEQSRERSCALPYTSV